MSAHRLVFPAAALAVLVGGAASAAGPTAPVNHSLIAFALTEKDLLPENVAFDANTGSFLVGSTRKGKILRVTADGTVSDFVGPRGHGLWMVAGMKADAERRRLWVVSSYGSGLEGYQARKGSPAALVSFDLDSGRPVARHVLDDGAPHVLNDLVLTPDGDVYVTHMIEAAQVWKLDEKSGTFAPFYRGDGSFREPNGIAFAADGRSLYVADAGGISRIDLASRERRALTAPKGVSLGGVDGLYLHRGSLILIQPRAKLVARLKLDVDGLRVTALEVLESQHPLFAEPSTGVIVGDVLYYIANSQQGRYDEGGTLFPLERLYQPVILKLPL